MRNKHWLDKPILRELFWFIVLPYRFKHWVKKHNEIKGGGSK